MTRRVLSGDGESRSPHGDKKCDHDGIIDQRTNAENTPERYE